MASRISAMLAETRSNAASISTSPAVAEPAGELVAGEHQVGDAAHHPVEQVDGQADGALGLADLDVRHRRRARAPRTAASISAPSASISGSSSSLASASPVSSAWTSSPIRSMTARTALTSRASAVRVPARTSASASFGGVAQRPEPRQIEEAAIALDGVDEAENLVEAGAVAGHAPPRRRSRPTAPPASRASPR